MTLGSRVRHTWRLRFTSPPSHMAEPFEGEVVGLMPNHYVIVRRDGGGRELLCNRTNLDVIEESK
jgi:hypothetical protein